MKIKTTSEGPTIKMSWDEYYKVHQAIIQYAIQWQRFRDTFKINHGKESPVAREAEQEYRDLYEAMEI